MLKNKNPIAKAHIKDSEIYFYFNLPSFAKITCRNPLGKDLVNFIWFDRENIKNIFNLIYHRYLLCKHYKIATDSIWDDLVEYMRPFATKNTYLTAYIASAIDFLMRDSIDDEDILTICKLLNCDFEDKNDLIETYTTDDLKGIMLGKLPEAISVQQDYLEADLELLANKESSLFECTPAQRLVILGNMGSLKLDYLSTGFSLSIDCVDDLRGLSGEKLCNHISENNTEFIEMYELPEIIDMLRFELVQTVLYQRPFKRCKYCRKLFIPSGRSDSEYCTRIAPNEEKPCSEIGAYRVRDADVRNNDVKKAYKKAYDRMYSRKRNGLIDDEFNDWSWQAIERRDKCLAGEITLAEYEAWLDKTKVRKHRDKEGLEE